VPEVILRKPPTPDLVPGQTTEGDFGISYDKVDRILYYLIRGMKPAEVVARGFTPEEVAKVAGGWNRRTGSAAPYRGDDVPDGDRRVLLATGGLLMQPKHPRDSETIMSELMMPQHANIWATCSGAWSCRSWTGWPPWPRSARLEACVTVSVDKVDFKEPIHVGELLTAYAASTSRAARRWKWASRSSPRTCSRVGGGTPIPAT